MSAPLSEPLFHGTSSVLKPGDIVKPHESTLGFGAYATTRPTIAETYAADPDRLRRGPQASMFGMVYEVEPLKGDETFDKQAAHSYNYTSQKGFKVKGLHKLVSGEYE